MFMVMRYDKAYCLANMRKFGTSAKAEAYAERCRIKNPDTVYNILEMVKSIGKRPSKNGY